MKKSTIILVPIVIVSGSYAGERYIHEDFRYYFLATLLFGWLGAYYFLRSANNKLASVLAGKEPHEREVFLQELDKDQRKKVEKLIENKVEPVAGGDATR
jgi:hypothetical protein